ncbi:unnamed protein product [Paramecium sonneborni]|uniref:THO complex subunit 2 N-terminal domain-containing protein n=1 Tax=Paramecium sonneborni TaxID=65129 RepID=A0A8S1RUR3_9CILI|nr:unnamed protein product [Paramecium sonneborni]
MMRRMYHVLMIQVNQQRNAFSQMCFQRQLQPKFIRLKPQLIRVINQFIINGKIQTSYLKSLAEQDLRQVLLLILNHALQDIIKMIIQKLQLLSQIVLDELKIQRCRIITQELINDDNRTINCFTVSDPRRKNKFIYQYLSDFYLSFTILLENLHLCTMVIQLTSDSRKLLIQLMQSLAERLTQTQKQIFFDNFDEEVLWECDFFFQDTFSQRKRKINTDIINFCQNKFWSMKDENEGYSKLMVEVLDSSKRIDIYDEENQQRIENIIHLIGYFNFDPDRVVDIIILHLVYHKQHNQKNDNSFFIISKNQYSI